MIMSHYGNSNTYEEVLAVATPRATATWQPVPHKTAIDTIEATFTAKGLEPQRRDFILANAKDGETGDRLFATWEFPGMNAGSHAFEVGFRHGHDKSVANAIAAGAHVFVCSNMCFSAEHILRRKHTANVLDDLPGIISDAIDLVLPERILMAQRFDAYKQRELSLADWDHFTSLCFRMGVIAPSKFNALQENFETPAYREHNGQTLWTAHNAVTETLKEYKGNNAAMALPSRTTALTQIADTMVGYCGN